MSGFVGKSSSAIPFTEPVGSLRSFAAGITVDPKYVPCDGRAVTPDMDLYAKIPAPAAISFKGDFLPVQSAAAPIVFGRGYFVLPNNTASPNTRIMYSSDRMDWILGPIVPFGPATSLFYSAYRQKFYAYDTATGFTFEATDPAASWEQLLLNSTNGLYQIIGETSTGRMFCANPSGGTASYSDDAWATIATGGATGLATVDRMAFGNNVLVAATVTVDQTNIAAWSADNGATWTLCTGFPASQFRVYAVVFGNGVFVFGISDEVSAYTAYIYSSADGKTFTQRASLSGSTRQWAFRLLSFSGSVFCTVYAANTVKTSPDGTTWTSRTLPISLPALSGTSGNCSLAGGDGVFIVTECTSTRNVLSSTDGNIKIIPPVAIQGGVQQCVRAYK